MAFPHDVVGWSGVYDYCISWSYSPLLGLVTKMPPCSNKVKHLLNILWNQKTKMPPIPYMELTFKFIWLTWYAYSKGGRTMLNYFFRSWIGFREVFSSFWVFVKGRKCRLTSVTEKLMSSIACYTVVSNQ